MSKSTQTMDKLVALCRRRGFIFGSSEIYGGIGGFWDYGPLGTELKRNIKNVWWHDMVINPPVGPDGSDVAMVGLDTSIIMNPKVWEASGHVKGFADPMVDCRECRKRFRADKVFYIVIGPEGTFSGFAGLMSGASQTPVEPVGERRTVVAVEADDPVEVQGAAEAAVRQYAKSNNIGFLKKFAVTGQSPGGGAVAGLTAESGDNRYECVIERLDRAACSPGSACPACAVPGALTEPRSFNLMFQTHVGALQDERSVAYLRPETAQGIFVNLKNVMDSTRVKVPFGIAQIGKAFRNEINPRNYTFRSREFEQMEIEFFCPPATSRQWYEFWRDTRLKWYEHLGIRSDRLRPREQGPDELAHYSDACTDIEYLFPFAEEPQELEGVAHRGCFDLAQHGKHSKGKEDAFAILDEDTRERYVPHVIEPSAGVDRFTLAVLCEAYTIDETRASDELLKIHPRLAPIKAAVFPLVAKDGMPEVAEPIYRELKRHYTCQYDAKQAIGRRYARMDEAGTPYCFTVDGQTLEDGTVTVRDRDTAAQERIDKSRCLEYLRERLHL